MRREQKQPWSEPKIIEVEIKMTEFDSGPSSDNALFSTCGGCS